VHCRRCSCFSTACFSTACFSTACFSTACFSTASLPQVAAVCHPLLLLIGCTTRLATTGRLPPLDAAPNAFVCCWGPSTGCCSPPPPAALVWCMHVLPPQVAEVVVPHLTNALRMLLLQVAAVYHPLQGTRGPPPGCLPSPGTYAASTNPAAAASKAAGGQPKSRKGAGGGASHDSGSDAGTGKNTMALEQHYGEPVIGYSRFIHAHNVTGSICVVGNSGSDSGRDPPTIEGPGS
jgi:hypothetical protein